MSTAILLILTAPLAFGLVAALAAFRPGRRPRTVERIGAIVSWYGVLVATGAGALTSARGLTETDTFGWRGLGFSLRLDPLSAIMFAMITLLAVIIFRPIQWGIGQDAVRADGTEATAHSPPLRP